jgi:general secretion pathway protein D
MIFGGCLVRRNSGYARQVSSVLLGLVLFVFATVVCPQTAHAQSASALYKQGEDAETKDDPVAAYEAYNSAFRKNPKDLKYKTAYERIRFVAAATLVNRGEKLRDQGDLTGAMTQFLHAVQVDPSNDLAAADIRKTRERLLTGSGPAPPAARQKIPK